MHGHEPWRRAIQLGSLVGNNMGFIVARTHSCPPTRGGPPKSQTDSQVASASHISRSLDRSITHHPHQNTHATSPIILIETHTRRPRPVKSQLILVVHIGTARDRQGQTEPDRQTDRKKDKTKETDRQTDRQIDRQTARQTDRQTDRQTGQTGPTDTDTEDRHRQTGQTGPTDTDTEDRHKREGSERPQTHQIMALQRLHVLTTQTTLSTEQLLARCWQGSAPHCTPESMYMCGVSA